MPSPVTEERVIVRVAALLTDITPALAWGTGAGLSIIAYYILRGLFSFTESAAGDLFGWIPGVNKLIQRTLASAEQRLTHWCGQAAASCEARMGDYFHAAGNQVASIGHEIYGEAVATWQIAQWLYKVAADVLSGEAWQEIFHNDITNLQAASEAQQRKVARQQKAVDHAHANPVGAGIKTATKATAATAARTATLTLPGLREWVRERENALEQDIKGTRAREAEAERVTDRLWDKVRHLDKVTTGLLASALVATALGRLGATWIRCSNWNRLGRGVCRMPGHFLDDLLGLLTDFIVLENICQVLPWLETAASDIAGPVIGTLSRAGAGVCAGSTGPAAQLHPPALYLAGTGGTPTLHLP